MGEFHIHKPSPRDGAKTPEEAIRKIRYSPVENLYVFKNGKQIRRFVGEVDRVTVDSIFLAEMKDATLVHNHPGGFPFSKEDVEAVCLYDARELVLVTHDYIYRASRPDKGWRIDFSDENIKQLYEESCAIGEDAVMKGVARNEISSYEKSREKIHYIWAIFFHFKDIKYVREKAL